MSFSFSSDAAESQAEPEPRRPPIPPERTRTAAPPPSEDGEFAFADDEEHVDESTEYADEERAEALDDEPRFVRGEDPYGADTEAPRRSGRSYLLFLGVVVLVYAILALDLSNDAARAEKLVAAVPIVGDLLGEDRLLQTRVQLQDVEGRYQQIKDDKLVLIVSGRAINGSRDALKGVQIESSLYDGSGKPIDTKSIYCGNAMSLKIVKDLSTKEISLLQGLEPPKRFEIRPGESAGFSVVFEKPAAGVKEFSARVVAALPSGA